MLIVTKISLINRRSDQSTLPRMRMSEEDCFTCNTLSTFCPLALNVLVTGCRLLHSSDTLTCTKPQSPSLLLWLGPTVKATAFVFYVTDQSVSYLCITDRDACISEWCKQSVTWFYVMLQQQELFLGPWAVNSYSFFFNLRKYCCISFCCPAWSLVWQVNVPAVPAMMITILGNQKSDGDIPAASSTNDTHG